VAATAPWLALAAGGFLGRGREGGYVLAGFMGGRWFGVEGRWKMEGKKAGEGGEAVAPLTGRSQVAVCSIVA
jgi:hypothetical protein